MARYIPNTSEDRAEMLSALGLSDIEELFSDIPDELRLKREMDLPKSMSEPELLSHLKQIAGNNANADDYTCFLGAGVYDHHIPSVVNHIVSRSEFYTSYTPYQPEISQGMLQAIFEYQTMICTLTGMDVSNASMYDGATALAEAMFMAVRATGRNNVAVSKGVHPEYIEVLKTYGKPIGINVREIELSGGKTDPAKIREAAEELAAVIVQSPNYFGVIEDLKQAAECAKDSGALSVACVDPISLGILRPPGDCGIDIAVGEGQSLGNPLSFGGPHFGFLAVKKPLMRKVPGRIVGQTVDHDGRRGFVLTLQAREQHIRREKAVSNICSNQSLNALAAAVYMSVMGKKGLVKVAKLCFDKAHYAYRKLIETGKFAPVFDAPFFKEFTVRALDEPVSEINKRLLRNRIMGGLDLGAGRFGINTGAACSADGNGGMENCWLVAVTEKRTRQEIDRFVEIAAGGGK